jgi:hypothetical protein
MAAETAAAAARASRVTGSPEKKTKIGAVGLQIFLLENVLLQDSCL